MIMANMLKNLLNIISMTKNLKKRLQTIRLVVVINIIVGLIALARRIYDHSKAL